MTRHLALARSLLLLLGATTAIANAQQAAVFELDDYVDPQLLGAVAQGDHFLAGNRFILVRLLAGTASDMEHQGYYTTGRTDFLHGVASYYDGARQWDLELTSLPEVSTTRDRFGRNPAPAPERGRVVPRSRVRLQYASYMAAPDDVAGEDEGEQSASRYVISVGHDQLPGQRSVYDLGVYFDVPLGKITKVGRLDFAHSFVGGLGYNWRILENGYDQHRILYYYSENKPWGDPGRAVRISTPVRLSFGGERSEGHWRWAPLRLELGARASLGRAAVQVSYALSGRMPSRGFEKEWNHEVAAFLDVVAISRVLPPRH